MKTNKEVHLFLEQLKQCLPKPFFDDISKDEKGSNFIIGYLAEHKDDKNNAGDLAKEMMVSTARIAALLNKLENQGLVKRMPSEKDKRITIVKLTQKGLEREKINKEQLIKNAQKLLDSITKDEQETFFKVLNKMKQIMESEEENENI